MKEQFIKKQIEMLNNGFAFSQIKDNVYRYVFSNGIPNVTINAMIERCMGLYAEILIQWES